MTAPRTSDQANNPTPALAGVLFARTHDGLLVAKVGDNAFAMMPAKNGRYLSRFGLAAVAADGRMVTRRFLRSWRRTRQTKPPSAPRP